jgi:hypothetical protein
MVVVSLALAMFPAIGGAQVGPRNFYSALITVGADPSNDLTLSPGWVTVAGRAQAAFSFTLEKQITNTTSILLGNALGDRARRRLQASSGVDDMEILAKWAFYLNAEHEFRSAIALDVWAPTGDVEAGAGGHWRGGPMILAEKGAGDLPDHGLLHYLRPFALQMDAEYMPRWTGSQEDLVAFDAALSYQLDYLSGPGSDFRANCRSSRWSSSLSSITSRWRSDCGPPAPRRPIGASPPASPTQLATISSRRERNWV